MAGTHVTSSRNVIRIASLPNTYSGPRQRLREIDLQRVGAAIVGNQPGAGIHGDEEQEDFLLLEKLTET